MVLAKLIMERKKKDGGKKERDAHKWNAEWQMRRNYWYRRTSTIGQCYQKLNANKFENLDKRGRF